MEAKLREYQVENLSLKAKIYAAMDHPELPGSIREVLQTGFTGEARELIESKVTAEKTAAAALDNLEDERARNRGLQSELNEAKTKIMELNEQFQSMFK